MSEATCIEHERANCAACAAREYKLSIALIKRAFSEGFARAADPDRAHKRHAIKPLTDPYWRAGFKAGLRAATEALEEYVRNEGLR